MNGTAPRFLMGTVSAICYGVERYFCGNKYQSLALYFLRLRNRTAQGFFCLYCVTLLRFFRIRSAACLRVTRPRQSGQYLTLFELDAKAAPHTVHRRLPSCWYNSA